MTIPKFKAGSFIDISYRKNSYRLPDRVKVVTVYMKENSIGWMYELESEANCKSEPVYMAEDDLANKEIHKNADVYSVPEIINMYKNGYRYAGCYSKSKAISVANEYVANHGSKISNAVIKRAYYANGKLSEKNFSVWIKYYGSINDYKEDIIVIK